MLEGAKRIHTVDLYRVDRETSSDSLLSSVKQRQEGVFGRMIFDGFDWRKMGHEIFSVFLGGFDVQSHNLSFQPLGVIFDLMLCRVTRYSFS